jgi:hypothetical protein
MKGFNGTLLFTLSLVLSLFMVVTRISFAADFYLHSATTDDLNNSAPTATTAKFKDSTAVNRTTYQQIGIWSAAPLFAPMQLQSLGSLVTWIGLKNSDDQGTYFDLKAELRKNGTVIAVGESKNIQGVTRNASLAKELSLAFGAISDSQFATGDVLSIRILTKVADSGGHNNAVGLRLYYGAVSRPSRFGATFGSPPPTKLVITAVNNGVNPVAGAPFSLTVQSQNTSSAPANVTIPTGVSLSLTSGSGALGGTLGGTIAAGSSQVTISGVTYTKAESGVVITATRASGDNLTPGDSEPFTVDPGAASALTFFTQPGNATAGSAIGGPPTVAVQDSLGNTVTSSTIYITVALGTNSGGSTLSGNATLYTVGGVVTFNDLSLNKAGAGYTLTASSPGLTGVTSSAFSNTPGAAAVLAFTTQPGNANVASNISGPPTITVRDNFGNTVTSSTASVTIGMGANPAGGTLSGTTTKNAVSGVASFSDLAVNQAGTGYTLTAASTGLSSVTSNIFNVSVPAGVSLAAVPNSVPAGDPFTVTWTQIPTAINRDWIGLFTAGSSDTAYLDYVYVGCGQSPTVPAASGACSFPISTNRTAGAYEFRLFPNDTFDRLATSNPVTIAPPSNQNKVAISVAATVMAGTPGFSVTVQSQTSSGVPVNVTSDTAIMVSLLLGNGVLGGTLIGTIVAGTNQAVIGPVMYSKAESGVVLTTARTSGDDLRAQNGLPFTVIPGPAAQLAFTTQPGNTTVGSTIPGPPTVIVQDNAGNAVTSITAIVSLALGSNPGGGALDNDISVKFGSSVSFPSLSINQLGNGYTLVASSAGLVSATSNPFNITLPGGGGTIAGVITRVSNGATISGALVEAFEGITLRGTAVTNSSGNYSITGLAAGSYTARASFTGLVPQMVNNVQVISGSTTTVPLSLNFGIAIQSPVAGATINDFSVLVTGNFDTSLAPQLGIQVNGYATLINGNEFATMIPLESQTTMVTATMTDSAGNFLAGDAVPITPQIPTVEPALIFRASPAIALVSAPVGFTVISRNEISQIDLDANGDEILDYTGPTLEGVSVTYAEPGLYFPTVRVTDTSNAEFIGSGIIHVLELTQQDATLRAMWDTMKNALRSGDTALAASYIVSSKRSDYQNIFNNLTIPFASIDQMLGNITYQGLKGLEIEYEMLMNDGPDGDVSYLVLFSLDADGVWRISFF